VGSLRTYVDACVGVGVDACADVDAGASQSADTEVDQSLMLQHGPVMLKIVYLIPDVKDLDLQRDKQKQKNSEEMVS
jgi:hypothetical protein